MPGPLRSNGEECVHGDRADAQRGAEDALGKVLADEDRYNRFHAGNALRRIDHPNTREALLDSLFTARWCPVTTAENMY